MTPSDEKTQAAFVPMEVVQRISPHGGGERILLVMLPGVNDVPQSFFQWGLIDRLANLAQPVDAVAVNVPIDDYLDHKLVERLDREIVLPAIENGYARVWLAGVSLGGMGSLLYCRAHPARVEGIILLAPYLGATGTIARIERAGGLARWDPPEELARDDDERLLFWVRNAWSEKGATQRRFLGYGRADRFRAGSKLLEPYVPERHVVVAEGGHDWETWAALWSGILERDPFKGAH